MTARPVDAATQEAREEAAVWLAKLTVGDRTPEVERAFAAWLARNPQNRAAFDWVNAAWETTGGLRHANIARAASVPATAGRPMLLERRALLSGVAATMIAGLTFGLWRHANAGVYETGIGEQRRVLLDDGSRLLLDTDTRLRVSFDERERRVELLRGRVNCNIAADSERPFVVEAAQRRLVATDSSLDVRCDGEAVEVTLIEGRALVSATDEAGRARSGAPRLLNTGQQLVVAPTAPDRIVALDLRKATAWQEGRAVFDGDTLMAAAAEMNRYSRTRLEIVDPAIADLGVSGVFHAGDNLAFARTIALFLPVQFRAEGDRILIMGKAAAADAPSSPSARG